MSIDQHDAGDRSRRHLRQEAGVRGELDRAVLDRLGQDGPLDRSRVCLVPVSVRAEGGAS